MISKCKHYPVIFFIVLSSLITCNNSKRELNGSWESILIENGFPIFAKTHPSSLKGEVILTFHNNETYTWFNKNEKLNLSGKYRISGKNIYLYMSSEIKPLMVKFKLINKQLIIITDDGFTFTFIKNKNL